MGVVFSSGYYLNDRLGLEFRYQQGLKNVLDPDIAGSITGKNRSLQLVVNYALKRGH